MKYCQSCGSVVELVIPDGDNRHRHVCTDCGDIHYQNPKIVAGCVPVWEDRVLLCNMENGETLEQAAQRECMEEANALMHNLRLYTVISLPHISQVYMMFLADLKNTDFFPGEESLETRLFSEDEIPWQSLAFKTIESTLRSFFKDRKTGQYTLHNSTIEKRNR